MAFFHVLSGIECLFFLGGDWIRNFKDFNLLGFSLTTDDHRPSWSRKKVVRMYVTWGKIQAAEEETET